jgi:hypothetical protein
MAREMMFERLGLLLLALTLLIMNDRVAWGASPFARVSRWMSCSRSSRSQPAARVMRLAGWID